MNDWKELEIGNLPPDILTGEYEWQMLQNIQWVTPVKEGEYLDVLQILNKLESKHKRYRYRRPEPKQPTHEEILTKWWRVGNSWTRVIEYNNEIGSAYLIYIEDRFVTADWFRGLESSDLPQEEMFAW